LTLWALISNLVLKFKGMKTYSVAEFKAQLSEILDIVQEGEQVAISYGRKKEVVAVLSPQPKKKPIKLGVLEGKGSVVFSDDWAMTEEEFLGE
jgi:prevent-host-death family protein